MVSALLGVIGGIIIVMLTLLLSIVMDIKKDVRLQKNCIEQKQDKAECIRIMDKHEAWIKSVEVKE